MPPMYDKVCPLLYGGDANRQGTFPFTSPPSSPQSLYLSPSSRPPLHTLLSAHSRLHAHPTWGWGPTVPGRGERGRGTGRRRRMRCGSRGWGLKGHREDGLTLPLGLHRRIGVLEAGGVHGWSGGWFSFAGRLPLRAHSAPSSLFLLLSLG